MVGGAAHLAAGAVSRSRSNKIYAQNGAPQARKIAAWRKVMAWRQW